MLHGRSDEKAAPLGGLDRVFSTARHFVPIGALVAALLLGHAAFDALPTVVAEREGGMGLGSALIVAQVFGVAGIAAGAIAAAYALDRGRPAWAVVAGALAHYAGMTAAGTAPIGAIGWITAAYGLAGVGLGAVATSAFVLAAGMGGRAVVAIVLLLLASSAARGVVGSLPAFGPAGLILPAAVVVAVAVLAVRGWPGRSPREASPARGGPGGRVLPLGAVLVGGALVVVGVVAMLAGADPSRLSAAMIAGSFGVGLPGLDGARAVLATVGLATALGGATLLLLRAGAGRTVGAAGAGVALVAVAGAGVVALLSLAGTTGGVPRPAPGVALAALVGTAAGIGLGGWWLAGTGRPRQVALTGTAVLAGAVGVGAALGFGGAGGLAALVVACAAGFGAGFAAPAMRLVLAEVVVTRRGLAAAVGVMGATSGAVLGSMVGIGEGLRSQAGGGQPPPVGALLLLAVALAAVGVAARLPARSSLSSVRPRRRETG